MDACTLKYADLDLEFSTSKGLRPNHSDSKKSSPSKNLDEPYKQLTELDNFLCSSGKLSKSEVAFLSFLGVPLSAKKIKKIIDLETFVQIGYEHPSGTSVLHNT